MFLGASFSIGCDNSSQTSVGTLANPSKELSQTFSNLEKAGEMEKATFGGGCFWCVEAVFLELKGVKSVKSGYMGGEVFLKTDGGTDYSLKDVEPAGYYGLSVFLNGKKMKASQDYEFAGRGRKMELRMASPSVSRMSYMLSLTIQRTNRFAARCQDTPRLFRSNTILP